MTTKKNDPSSGTKPAGGTGGSKKPYATLDLRAVEVISTENGEPDKKGSPSTAEAATASGSTKKSDNTNTTKSSKEPEKAAAPREEKKATASGAQTTSDAKSKTGSGAAGGGKKQTTHPQAQTAKPERGGRLSHLVAGLAGGVLALVGAEAVGPGFLGTLGLPSASFDSEQRLTTLDERLAALETQSRAANTQGDDTNQAELASQLAETQKRIGELESVTAQVGALESSLSKLQERAAAQDQKDAAAVAGGSNVAERLAAVEDRLGTIAAAADAPAGDTGTIPQLAAITGRLTDLEQALASQAAALRQDVQNEFGRQLTQSVEAAEAAKAGTTRIDKVVAGLQAETARLTHGSETADAERERIAENARRQREENARLRSELEQLKNDIELRLSKVSYPEDVVSALSPVSDKIAALEDKVSGVVKSEQNREENSRLIVLSLELANLKRALDSGEAFQQQLSQVEKVGGKSSDLEILKPFETKGVPTLSQLQNSFRDVAHAIIDSQASPTEGSVLAQLLAGAKSVVRVRRTDYSADDNSIEAVVARMEQDLNEGNLGGVLTVAGTLPQNATEPASDWLGKARARHSVDQALARIEGQLKDSLGGTAAPSATSTE